MDLESKILIVCAIFLALGIIAYRAGWLRVFYRSRPTGRNDNNDSSAKEEDGFTDLHRDNELQRQLICQQILSWKDTYKTHIEEKLTHAFPALEVRLKEVVSENIINMVKNGPKKFTTELLEPEINSWVKRHAEPLLQSAQEELTQIVDHTIEASSQFRQGSLENENMCLVGADIMAPIAAIIAGIGTVVVGFSYGFLPFLWFFTMISWPILIGGLVVVGGVLSLFGVVKISHLKDKLTNRFCNLFLPKIREALIGDGYELKKQHFPSLKNQLQESIEQAATNILREIRK